MPHSNIFHRTSKGLALSGLLLGLTSSAWAACPAVTVADMKGVAPGKYPQQFELSTFEKNASCELSFSENPDIKALNARIRGNTQNLPSVEDRLPEEPLVVAPYEAIGSYGGTFRALSNATEAGTSDFLSVRHVNLVRYSDDLETIVPNVAKDWEWNSDYTELTFFLRKGHKWSDGAPFTAEDIKFWYDDLNFDTNVVEKPKDFLLVGGERMQVEVVNETTVKFILPAPKPGLLAHFATSYAQGFQPKHFLGQFHPKYNKDADKMAKAAGFENGYAVIKAYYGSSDWTDTPSPLLNSPDKVGKLPADVVPTLESHIYVTDTTEGRHLVANPYFFMVDTQGHQLPYISEQDEVYINDHEVRKLKAMNGEIEYKAQSFKLPDAPFLLDGQDKGDYSVYLKPAIAMPTFSFNVTSEDLEKRKVFGDLRFRQAMSLAINRDELNDVAFLGLGTPQQYIGFSPAPKFVDAKWKNHYINYDPAEANKLLDQVGLKDVDGDGFRELPNGKKLVLNMQFATQGMSSQLAEMVAQYWSAVGVQATTKEVTPDEYRSSQSSNKLDVGMWEKGQPMAIILGNAELFMPPFENYFAHRAGMLWAEYVESNGSQGVKPPQYVMDMINDINAFQSAAPGSAESNRLGAQLVENMAKHLLFIGTVLGPEPIYRSNSLKNFREFQTTSYEYYRTFPYRGPQWYLAN